MQLMDTAFDEAHMFLHLQLVWNSLSHVTRLCALLSDVHRVYLICHENATGHPCRDSRIVTDLVIVSANDSATEEF